MRALADHVQRSVPSPCKGEGQDGGVLFTHPHPNPPPSRGRVLLLSAIAAVLVFSAAHADVPAPKIPKGKGDQCVEDTQYMRRNHMEVILHQRDETVHNGIRTKKHSLKGCLNCHAVNNEQGQPVAFTDPRHFCTVCHSYASVSIDCFECHSSKPEPQAAVTTP